MLGFLKKRLWREMGGYCVSIQIATFNQFTQDFVQELGRDEGDQLAAAVTNRLFGMPRSPAHEKLGAARIDKIAQIFVKLEHGTDLFLGILLSLRTDAVIATDQGDAERLQRIRDTIQWMASITPLPPDAPDPRIMKKLATELSQAYPSPKGE